MYMGRQNVPVFRGIHGITAGHQISIIGSSINIAYMYKLTFELFHEGNLILTLYYIELF